MKQTLSLIILIATLLFAGTHSQASWSGPKPDPKLSGVLVEANGPVEFISPSGKTLSPVSGSELKPGSIIEPRGGSATVMLADGTVVKVADDKFYIVGSKKLGREQEEKFSGVRLALNEAANVKIPTTIEDIAKATPKAEAKPRVRGMVKMGNLGPGSMGRVSVSVAPKKKKAPPRKASGLEAIFPVNTTIMLKRDITFTWKHRVRFAKPVVAVEGTALKRATVGIPEEPGTKTSGSSAGIGIKKGAKYTWYLASGKDDAKKKRSQVFKFRVLSEEEERMLKQDLSRVDGMASTSEGRALLRSQIYYNYGMYYDMIETLIPTWKDNRSPSARKLIKLGYVKMKQYDEARKYQ